MTAPSLDVAALSALPEDALDARLRDFAREHGAEALPVLAALAAEGADRAVRRAAKRALYRLSQRGVTAPPRPAPKPIVASRTSSAS